MLYTNKEKVSKLNLNSFSIPSSPSQTQATTKKKMFARKPANVVVCLPSDKKKSVLQDSSPIPCQLKALPQQYRHNTSFGQSNESRMPIKPVDLFGSGPEKKEAHLSRYREIFFSPKADKSLVVSNVGIIQRKQSKNHTECKDKDSQDGTFRNSFAFRRETNTIDNDQMRKSWKFKTNSVQSFVPLLKSNQAKNDTISSTKSIIDRSITAECSYCLNHKKRADLVTERYTKLQEQFNIKMEVIGQLTLKCDNIAKEKSEICKKLQASIDKIQAKQVEFFKMREDLTMRIDSYKKEIIRLTEANKYSQIQKSMLLRFKNDYHSTLKECQALRYENDQYKKQIIALANKAHGYSFGKNHINSPEKSNESSPRQFSKKTQNGALIYYDCQDDALSLNFSQHSLDYA